MKTLTLRITLKTDVIFTERAATIGGPATLDYIPGAALLGATAALLYNDLAPQEQFDVFHSGAVRFGNGRPEGLGLAAMPSPLSFHTVKFDENKNAVNLARRQRQPGLQYDACPRGWVLDTIHLGDNSVTVLGRSPRSSMRTSIDEFGKAREGLLFGLESLPEGQTFIARIDAEDERHLKRIEDVLSKKTLLLGRSKTAEFGEVLVEAIGTTDTAPPEYREGNTILFLCTSDVALRDTTTGAPRLRPQPSDFALPQEWSFDASHSFLRSRRYSPFNRHRNRHDWERQVISAGSVLAFRTNGIVAAGLKDRLVERIALGIGDYRQDGLGQVALEPPVLREEEILLKEMDTEQLRPEVQLADELANWLEKRAHTAELRDRAIGEVEKYVSVFYKYDLSNSQWGWLRSLAQAAQHHAGGGEWLKQQFDTDTTPPLTLKQQKALEEKRQPRPKDGGGRALRWSARHQGKAARERMIDWMKDIPAADLGVRVEMLAMRVVRRKAMEGVE